MNCRQLPKSLIFWDNWNLCNIPPLKVALKSHKSYQHTRKETKHWNFKSLKWNNKRKNLKTCSLREIKNMKKISSTSKGDLIRKLKFNLSPLKEYHWLFKIQKSLLLSQIVRLYTNHPLMKKGLNPQINSQAPFL
jgi:hypothetical protein